MAMKSPDSQLSFAAGRHSFSYLSWDYPDSWHRMKLIGVLSFTPQFTET